MPSVKDMACYSTNATLSHHHLLSSFQWHLYTPLMVVEVLIFDATSQPLWQQIQRNYALRENRMQACRRLLHIVA